jgi:hypothetical protein
MTPATAPRPVARPTHAPPPERPTQAAASRQAPPPRKKVAFGALEPQGHRILLYGGGGTGKSTLACNAPAPVALFDLELSMPILRPQIPEAADIRIVAGVEGWQDLRDALHADGWDEVRTLVIDSVTKAEELAVAWVMDNVPVDDKRKANRIEDYPYGKGYTHVYETFLALLGDLDAHVRAGRHVILIAHDCTTQVPNPHGEDWLRYEPRLQSPSSGKNSIRLRVREWADHVLFLGFDLGDVRDGKMATGFSGRTLYPVELPHCMAKSRTCDTAQTVTKNDPAVWTKVIPA